VAAATSVVLGIAVVAPAYIADRDVRQASDRWTTDPAAAFTRLDQAAALNPLDPRPVVVEGLIAARIGDLGRSQRALAEAGRRESHNWFIRFARGLVESARGDTRAAARQLRAARELNPREGLIDEALRRVNRPQPMGLGEARARLARRFERLRA
jgi:Flp pilus assembly protein TadD